MDGNGRWAQNRGLPRSMGHRQGVEALKRTVRAAAELEIGALTVFGFSTENWSRPPEEISELMRLLRMYLRAETAELHQSGVRLRVMGDRSMFDHEVVELIGNAERLTENNKDLVLNIALNYGGRQEVLQAASRWAQACAEKGLAPSFENAEEYLPSFLMTEGLPDPDILIRTSGEQRISNFLLWQCAYAEFFFVPTLWPDFSKADLEAVIAEYNGRERRFGGLKAHTPGAES